MNCSKTKLSKRILCLISAIVIPLLLSALSEGKSVNKKSHLSEDTNVNPEKLGQNVECGSVTKIYENGSAADIKLRIYATDRCQERESIVKIFDGSNELIMHFMLGYQKVKSRTVLVPPEDYVIFECNGKKPKKNAFLYKCTYKVTYKVTEVP